MTVSRVDMLGLAAIGHSFARREKDERERKETLIDMPEFQDALYWYREGMFILLKPVSGWLVDDGVRSMDERGQNPEVFRNLLKELDIPFVELGEEIKNIQARVEFAKRLIMRMVRTACLFETRYP